MLRRARALDIPIPQTLGLEPSDDLLAGAERMGYPVVVKPRFSRFLQDGRWRSTEVRYAASPQELESALRAAGAGAPEALVQEKIQGDGVGAFLLLWNGELKAAFCHRRLREKPPWGGVSVLRESIPLDRELVAQSEALLRVIGWQGAAMVEFKRDARDGRHRLMEVNGRFWGSLQLAIDAGMNFPLMLYRLATGEPVPASFDYRAGVRSRWWLGDLDNLLIRLRGSRMMNGAAGSRWGAIREFMEPGGELQRNEIFRSGDRGPGWRELKDYVREALTPAHGGRR